jgi:hypothetical protein
MLRELVSIFAQRLPADRITDKEVWLCRFSDYERD